MKLDIFRQYDVRGVVDTYFTADDAARIAAYFVHDVREQGHPFERVIVGSDGRLHSPLFKQKIEEALIAYGCTVYDIGLVPTPLVYFALRQHKGDVGIMITASHNGPEYNGLKLCYGAMSYAGADIERLAARVTQGQALPKRSGGSVTRTCLDQEYIAWMQQQFPDLQGAVLRCSIDCGHGATGPLLKALVAAMDFRDTACLYADVDGTWPVHGPDPVDRKNTRHVAAHIQQSGHEWGVAFDGDGDRMVVIDDRGEPCPGDYLLACWAQHLAPSYPGAVVVCDSKCSMVLDMVAAQEGLHLARVATGHTHIKNAMKQYRAILGGELSCHFFFADSYFGYDDGIYAFLRAARLIRERGSSIRTMMAELPATAVIDEQRIPCAPHAQAHIMEIIKQYAGARLADHPHDNVQTYDGVRYTTRSGWWLIRPSHTQPVLCVRAESSSPEGLAEMINDMQNALYAAGYDKPLQGSGL